MQIVINLPESPCVMIAKTHELEIDVSRLSQGILDHIFAYGLKQKLNDGAALAKGATSEEKLASATKRLEALYEGKLRKDRAIAAKKTALDKVIEQVAAEMVKKSVGHVTGKGEWKATPAQMEKAKEYAAKYDLDLSDAEGFIEAMRDIAAAHPVAIAEGTAKYEAEIARAAKLEAAASDVF